MEEYPKQWAESECGVGTLVKTPLQSQVGGAKGPSVLALNDGVICSGGDKITNN